MSETNFCVPPRDFIRRLSSVNFEFNIDEVRATHLPVGVYGLEVRATDPEGLYVSASFTVTCQDLLTPIINHPPDILLSEEDPLDNEYIVWTVEDHSLLTYVILLDGDEVQTGNLTDFISYHVQIPISSIGTPRYIK